MTGARLAETAASRVHVVNPDGALRPRLGTCCSRLRAQHVPGATRGLSAVTECNPAFAMPC
jgi:hypothetical protein